MSENPLNEQMDKVEEEMEENATDEQDSPLDDFDVEEFIDELNEGKKTETIGIAVTEEMHKVWTQLREDDDVDVDVAESIRQHLINLAQRHQTATEKAGRKLEIDRKF